MIFYTIGHSNRSFDEFVKILKSVEIDFIVDVRSVPRSRHNPQFNEETLPDELSKFEIGYERIVKLGGFRKASKDLTPETNAWWENASFHRYADYATTEDFRAGFAELINLAENLDTHHKIALMCSEAVWWRCHRRIITDYLLVQNQPVFHIMGENKLVKAELNPFASLQTGNKIFYPVR